MVNMGHSKITVGDPFYSPALHVEGTVQEVLSGGVIIIEDDSKTYFVPLENDLSIADAPTNSLIGDCPIENLPPATGRVIEKLFQPALGAGKTDLSNAEAGILIMQHVYAAFEEQRMADPVVDRCLSAVLVTYGQEWAAQIESFQYFQDCLIMPE